MLGFFKKHFTKDKSLDPVNLEFESGNRLDALSLPIKRIITALAVIWSLFQAYTGVFGLYPALIQRSFTLGMGLLLVFFCFQSGKRHRNRLAVIDIFLLLLSVITVGYLWYNYRSLISKGGSPSPEDVVMGVILVILVFEATRRAVGLPLVVVGGLFVVYIFVGPNLPGLLGHRGYSIARFSSHMFFTAEGIFGVPMSVMTTFVYAFILFGCFLEATGGAKLFINLAFSLAGRFAGGPAKTAVVASGLLGTISGSSLANVVTTGSFTIPLMKNCGYKPTFAGGVEASSSAAGQIMPPVMGAVAFIMARNNRYSLPDNLRNSSNSGCTLLFISAVER